MLHRIFEGETRGSVKKYLRYTDLIGLYISVTTNAGADRSWVLFKCTQESAENAGEVKARRSSRLHGIRGLKLKGRAPIPERTYCVV